MIKLKKKLKLWQNLNWDKTQIETKIEINQNVVTVMTTKLFLTKKNISYIFFLSPKNLFPQKYFSKSVRKKLNCEETQKLKLWWSSTTPIVMKIINSNCDKTRKLKLGFKKFLNLNFDKIQKLKLWLNSKTQTVMKLKNSNCDETKKTQMVTKLKLWQNSNWDKNKKIKCGKIQIVTKPLNSNNDKTQKLKFWQNAKTQIVT